MTINRADALNEALDRLGSYHYLDMPGPFACHGPMGAETLSILGHNDLVAAWVEEYKSRHEPFDAFPTVERIDPSDQASWRAAPGDIFRLSDWAALFYAELADDAWPVVVRRWLPRLLPGSAGALTHGVIRVSHAVGALDRRPQTIAASAGRAGQRPRSVVRRLHVPARSTGAGRAAHPRPGHIQTAPTGTAMGSYRGPAPSPASTS